MNIAVFCSGYGSNFQAIIDAAKKGLFKAKVALMVCDNKEAFALERAKIENIKALLVLRQDFKSPGEFEKRIMETLTIENIELICLAGFMRVLSPAFVSKYQNKILNIHPALLPLFKGSHAIKDAFDAGVKNTGVTVHFVTEELDSGPVILQETVEIEEADTLQSLEEKIHKLEHKLYPEAIRLFTEKRLKVEDKRVRIK